MVPVLKGLQQPNLTARERAEKQQEIASLREQYRREMEPIDVFCRELEPKLQEAERAFTLKDPEIERMREEMTCIVERKGRDEGKEIERVRGEFARRLDELTRRPQ